MKVTTEEFDSCEVLMTVEIEDKQKDRLLDKAARRLSREVKLPGFRPGKAPFRVVVNKFGIEAIQNEAMEDLTTNVFEKALKEAEVTPFAQASLDDVAWEPLIMKVKIPVEPVIELGAYRDMRIDFEEPELSDEEIEDELSRLQEQQATYETVERAAQLGDRVTVTTSEKDLESGEMLVEEDENTITIQEPDEDAARPDVGTQIIDMSAGEQKTFNHTYPDDHFQADLSGKSVEVFVRVEGIEEKDLPDLDDDFAALIGDYETLDDLKEKVSADLTTRKQYDIDRGLITDVVDRVLGDVQSAKWPAVLENQELDNAIEQQKQDAARQGMDWQTFLQTQQKTEEELREDSRSDVQESIKRSLTLGKIIEEEKLQVDPEELRQRAEMMVMLSGNSPQAMESFTSPAGLQLMANNMLYDQAQQHLLRIAKGEVEAEELAAAEAAAKAAEEAENEAEADDDDEPAADATVDADNEVESNTEVANVGETEETTDQSVDTDSE